MGLTDREKQIIEAMERELASEDPRLVATMERRRPGLIFNLLAVILGIALILSGVIAKFALLGIIGFLVALGGAATVRIGKPNIKVKGTGFKGKGSIQERWDRRNQ